MVLIFNFPLVFVALFNVALLQFLVFNVEHFYYCTILMLYYLMLH